MDDFDKQISSIIQYESYFKKKKDMKGQKTVCPTIPIQERNKWSLMILNSSDNKVQSCTISVILKGRTLIRGSWV